MNIECVQSGEVKTIDPIIGSTALRFGSGLAVALELASITILLKDEHSVEIGGSAAYYQARIDLLRAHIGLR